MAATLKLLTEVMVFQDEFMDILQPMGPSKVMLLIHRAILQPAQIIWHTPAFCAPTPKHAEQRYFVPAKNTDFLFMHQPSNSLVVQATVQRVRQQHPRVTFPKTGRKKVRPCQPQGIFISWPPIPHSQLSGYTSEI